MKVQGLELYQGISVVIPAYNREATIEACIQSVLNQTYLPQEILVIDDSSTDGTGAIVKKLAEKHRIIKYYCLDKNSGAQAARNFGIMHASSNWIELNDSDDMLEKDALRKQLEVLAMEKYAYNTLIYCDCKVVEAETGNTYYWHRPSTVGMGIALYRQMLKEYGPMFSGFLTSKRALVEIGLLDENVPAFQEWDTSIRLAKICKVIHIRDALFQYYVHDTEFRNPKRDFQGFQYIIDKYKDDIERLCGVETQYNHYMRQMNKLMHLRDRKMYFEYLRQYSNLHLGRLEHWVWKLLYFMNFSKGIMMLAGVHYLKNHGLCMTLKKLGKIIIP